MFESSNREMGNKSPDYAKWLVQTKWTYVLF